MSRYALLDLERRFHAVGLNVESEMLLLPKDALRFSLDAEHLGFPTTGVDVWVAAPIPGPSPLVQESGAGRYVPTAILGADFAVPASHAIVRDYLEHWLPAAAVRVHIGLVERPASAPADATA